MEIVVSNIMMAVGIEVAMLTLIVLVVGYFLYKRYKLLSKKIDVINGNLASLSVQCVKMEKRISKLEKEYSENYASLFTVRKDDELACSLVGSLVRILD